MDSKTAPAIACIAIRNRSSDFRMHLYVKGRGMDFAMPGLGTIRGNEQAHQQAEQKGNSKRREFVLFKKRPTDLRRRRQRSLGSV